MNKLITEKILTNHQILLWSKKKGINYQALEFLKQWAKWETKIKKQQNSIILLDDFEKQATEKYEQDLSCEIPGLRKIVEKDPLFLTACFCRSNEPEFIKSRRNNEPKGGSHE